jgi:hypothetical protein
MTLLRLTFALLSLPVLAACGADGAPVAPSQSATQPGITIEGKATVGIVGR